MNKRDKIIDQLTEELAKANKANERLIEIAYRKEAQIARKNHDCKETERFRKRMRRLKFVDFKETAISIFGWEDLPEGNFNFFNSKRLETQINRYGKVCVFKHKYRFMGADGNEHVEEVFLCLPFTGVAGSLDCYGEFTVIKPYAPAGTLNVEYPELVVNKDCVIFTDFFEWSSTNGNVSLSVNDAIDLYASLIADCEAAKRINRNWIKIPFLFALRKFRAVILIVCGNGLYIFCVFRYDCIVVIFYTFDNTLYFGNHAVYFFVRCRRVEIE